MNKPFAEVIESSLDNFLAQCWQWNNIPNFGSLIQVETTGQVIFGIVTQIQTGSMDPMRYPFPYKKTEEELMKEQPQIFEFLKTTFRVQIVGYLETTPKTNKLQTLYYQLPPTPCKIHSFITKTSQKLSQDFFSKPDYLYLLFGFENNIPNLDELLIAIVRQLSEESFGAKKIDLFYETLSLLTGNDYKRLKLFLKRTQNIIH